MSDTQALFYAIGIYVVFFAAIFWHYGQLTATVVRWSKPPVRKKGSNVITQPKLTLGEKVKCYIPMYQACLVRKSLYRSSGVFGVLAIIASAGILGNLFNKFVFAINSYVMFAFNIIMFVSVLLFWLVYAIITADCAKMFGFSWMTIVLCFVAPWLACWYLTNNVPTKMKAIHKEATFSEDNGHTVIKQRHN